MHDDDQPEDDPAAPFPHGLPAPAFAPVPEAFHSEETGEPFTTCIDCGGDLADGPEYLIQKCSNGQETVFEFAICSTCAGALHASYSEASRAAVSGFFNERANPEERMRTLLGQHPNGDLDTWLGTCITCGKPPKPGRPFATAALCGGLDLIYAHAPFLICEECELELNEHISPETRGEWDRFVGENFDLPPSEVLTPDAPPIILA